MTSERRPSGWSSTHGFNTWTSPPTLIRFFRLNLGVDPHEFNISLWKIVWLADRKKTRIYNSWWWFKYFLTKLIYNQGLYFLEGVFRASKMCYFLFLNLNFLKIKFLNNLNWAILDIAVHRYKLTNILKKPEI